MAEMTGSAASVAKEMRALADAMDFKDQDDQEELLENWEAEFGPGAREMTLANAKLVRDAAQIVDESARDRCVKHGAHSPEGDCMFCDKEQAQEERGEAAVLLVRAMKDGYDEEWADDVKRFFDGHPELLDLANLDLEAERG